MAVPPWIKKIITPKVRQKQLIPIYAPYFSDTEKKYLLDCLENTWISPKGNFVGLFEKAFARYCGSAFALSCSSGTASLFLSLKVLGIKKGDEVILPALTMASSGFAIVYTGAKPVFADVLEDTGNIDPEEITRLITPKTKAIIPVHLYGQPAEMDLISQISGNNRLFVVEDAAEAIGSEYRGKKIGSLSLLSSFSLYINKIVTTGQGGMITTNSEKLYRELKRLNNYYFSQKRHFWHQKIGFNFLMTNLQAAIGMAQIEKIDKILEKKMQIALWYRQFLSSLGEKFFPLKINHDIKTNYWMIAYRLSDKKRNVMDLRRLLAKNGIETRCFFLPLHLQPCFRKKKYQGKFPKAEALAKTGILLPSGPTLRHEDVEKICSLILKYFKSKL